MNPTAFYDEPTHTARTPEEYRILLLERQVDHLTAILAPEHGRAMQEIGSLYRGQRREFPLPSEETPVGPDVDVDEALREAENALEQAALGLDPHRVTLPTKPLLAVIENARDRVRRVLADRGVTE